MERRLQKLLNAAEKMISELKAQISKLASKNSSLTKELDEYRSIRGQLNHGKLKQENTELREQNGFFKFVMEKQGLSHLLSSEGETQKPETSKHDYLR